MTSTTDNVLRRALEDCLTLIEDMSRFVGKMSLKDYQLFNEAPIRARAALTAAHPQGADDELEFSGTDMKIGINIVLETIAKKFEANEMWDIWKSDAAALVRSYKRSAADIGHPQGADDWRAGVEAAAKVADKLYNEHGDIIAECIRNLQPPASVEATGAGREDSPQRIEVDIGAAMQTLLASPELCQQMNELVGGPALVEAQAEIERLQAELASLHTTAPHDQPGSPEREDIERTLDGLDRSAERLHRMADAGMPTPITGEQGFVTKDDLSIAMRRET